MPRTDTPAPPFPLYLLPSFTLPFRRRRSSAISTFSTSTSESSSPPTEPSSYLSSAPTSHLRCQQCLTDLAPIASIISKAFTGRHGRAYLIAPPDMSALHAGGVRATLARDGHATGDLPNTHVHKPVARQLVTGQHTVSDISCRQCGSVLGWKYIAAEQEAQKYKVGKYILETMRVVRGSGWEETEVEADLRSGMQYGLGMDKGAADEGEAEFDSQDEDECDDLFSGTWTSQNAKKRKDRGFGKRV